MNAYLGAVWNCRYFWLSLVKMDLRARYRGSVLGIGWSLLHPIAMTTILCVVFRFAFRMDWRTYAPYVFIGMTFWGFFSAALVQGCGCFFQGESYIRQFPAPMAIYPLRTVLASAFHFSIGVFLAIILALCMGPTEKHSASVAADPGDTAAVGASRLAMIGGGGSAPIPPPATSVATPAPSPSRVPQLLAMPSLIPTFALLLLFGWGVAVLFGLLNVRFRDTHHLAEIGLQGLFYMTPIMIPEDLGGRRLGLVLQWNPLTAFLKLLREPILYGHVPSLTMYATAGAIVLVVVGTAMLALKTQERQLIFHL
jgi:ABC-type polysaccharide/polyol phosphate export permease